MVGHCMKQDAGQDGPSVRSSKASLLYLGGFFAQEDFHLFTPCSIMLFSAERETCSLEENESLSLKGPFLVSEPDAQASVSSLPFVSVVPFLLCQCS